MVLVLLTGYIQFPQIIVTPFLSCASIVKCSVRASTSLGTTGSVAKQTSCAHVQVDEDSPVQELWDHGQVDQTPHVGTGPAPTSQQVLHGSRYRAHSKTSQGIYGISPHSPGSSAACG